MMINLTTAIVKTLLCVYLFSFFTLSVQANKDNNNTINNTRSYHTSKQYKILVIQSYQVNLERSKELDQGIENCLYKNQTNADIFTIYLDSKRIYPPSRYLSNLIVAMNDYENENIDLIIACDNNAFHTLMQAKHPLSEKVPVVFCGVEEVPRNINNYKNVTGITECFDFFNTFKLGMKLFPKTQNIVIITENSQAGKIARKAAEKQLKDVTANMHIEFIDGTEGATTTMLLSRLQNLPQNSMVIMSTFSKTYNNEYLKPKDFLPLLSASCPAPIFSIEKMNIGNGALGGIISNASEHSYAATQIGIDILRGKDIADIPVKLLQTESSVFDWEQLNRWRINSRSLPANSEILNQPMNIYDTFRPQIYIVSILLFCLLLLCLFVLWYHLKYRAKIAETDKEVNIAQQNLFEHQKRLFIILNSIADGVIAINNNNEIILINPVAMSYIASTTDAFEYLGKDINGFLHITCPRKDCTLNKLINTAIESESPTLLHENAILVPLNNEKNTIHVAGSISRMKNEDNEISGVVIVFRDVTEEHKQKEELIRAKNKALESDNLKTAFLANMSHEIRTPLNGIVGFANLLAEGGYEEGEKEQFIQIINSNCEILLGLISDILDLSRIESGSLSFRMEECILNPLFNNIITTLEVNATSGVKLIKDIPEKEIKIVTDNLRLTQVITNLINNAIKFTKEGSITIGYQLVENDEVINIFVKDTGCGMSKDDLKNIFNRFYKKNEFVQGVGLGLAICDAIVERFGGTITVDSEIGKGTTFNVYLPYFRSTSYLHPDAAVANVKNANQIKLKLQRKVILVAEDDESNFKLIDAVLSRKYKLLRAWNGEEALELFRTKPVDLVLLDVKMPAMTGIEALIEIRKLSPDIPVIMQTAYAFSSDKEEAIRAGCNDFITKPLQIDVLKDAIKKYLEDENENNN